MASYYARNAPVIDGAFLEGEIWMILHSYLNMYVYGKVGWNTRTDMEQLLAEHHQKLFGPADKPMEQFYNRLEELWVGQGLPKIENTALGPTPVKRSQHEILGRVYSEAVILELGNYITEAEKMAGKDEDVLKRLQFVRRTFWAPLNEASGEYKRQKRELDDLVMDVPIIPADQPVALDGKLDEPVWQNAAKVQMVPAAEKGASPLKTCVSVFYQAGKLYLGFDCEEPKTDDMMLAVQARDGNVWSDSCVEIVIKPGMERSRKDFYHMMINANGIVADEKGLVPGKTDWKWNADVQAKGTIGTNGRYVIEAAVPLDALLGHAVAPGETILANFARARFLKNDKPKDPMTIYYS